MTYGDLFVTSLQHYGILSIGLYRLRDATLSAAENPSAKRYVITNPPDDMTLLRTDKVSVCVRASVRASSAWHTSSLILSRESLQPANVRESVQGFGVWPSDLSIGISRWLFRQSPPHTKCGHPPNDAISVGCAIGSEWRHCHMASRLVNRAQRYSNGQSCRMIMRLWIRMTAAVDGHVNGIRLSRSVIRRQGHQICDVRMGDMNVAD